MSVTQLDLDKVFGDRRVPPWLRLFTGDPSGAVADLLLDRAPLGHLGAAESSQLLLDWLAFIGTQGDFAAEVDRALVDWIASGWGQPIHPLAAGSAALTSGAWCRAADVIAGSDLLRGAARALRERLVVDRSFLSALVEGRSRDPEGRSWLALARHQEDRSLLAEWWRLCQLPPDEPWYRGMYGLHGLGGLPPETPGKGHGFPLEVAEGLVRLALGLRRRVDDGWLTEEEARDEHVRNARLMMAAYPFEEKWESFWRHHLENDHFQSIQGWLRRLSHSAAKEPAYGGQAKRTRAQWPQPPFGWKDTAKEIAQALARHEPAAFARAEKLLADQRRYADQTGDEQFVVRSACQFAARAREHDAGRALTWALLARQYDAWHEHAWNTTAECLLTLGRRDEALETAGEAVRRFPRNGVARNTMAEILRARGQRGVAEAVYRETVSRFPDAPVSRNSLASLLLEMGRSTEAEEIAREATRQFKTDTYARSLLAEALKAQGRFDEAAVIYQETVDKFHDEVARRGLRNLQKKRVPAPRTSMRETPADGAEDRQPPSEPLHLRDQDARTLVTDVHLLRRWARVAGVTDAFPGELRDRARTLLRRWVDSSAQAASELGLWDVEANDLSSACNLLRQAASRYPGSARVHYALARAERALAAAEGRILDEKQPSIVIHPWRRLGRLDERYAPVAALGQGRAWLALVDGETVAGEARLSFARLGRWIHRQLRPTTGPVREPFASWWAGEVRTLVFDGIDVTAEEQIPDPERMRARMQQQGPVLDALEEDWVMRIATS